MAFRNLMLREDAVELHRDPETGIPHSITVSGRGRTFRLRHRPRVVLYSGRGGRIRFQAVADISDGGEVKYLPQPSRPEGAPKGPAPWERTLELENYRELSPEATLTNFAYSLVGIVRISQPWRHIGSGWTMRDEDVETLEKLQVNLRRTTYFGLLAQLPSPWAETLDTLAQARREVKIVFGAAEVGRASDSDYTALPELLALLERHVVTVAQFALDIAGRHREVLGAQEPPPLIVDGAAEPSTREAIRFGGQGAWDLKPLFQLTDRDVAETQRTRSLLADASEGSDSEFAERRVAWQPYRW